MVGPSAREQALADAPRPAVDLSVQGGLHRVGVAQDVAIDVPAAADRVDHDPIDPLDQGLQVVLQDPVELEGLARGKADGPIA